MLDFIKIKIEEKSYNKKKSVCTVYPEFLVMKSNDLMIRGGAFYAVWDEKRGFWSKDEDDVQRMVDDALYKAGEEIESEFPVSYKFLRDFSSKKWSEWKSYCKSLPDNYHELDSNVTFQNDKIRKRDYVSKTLPYPIDDGSIEAYDELVGTIYDPSERQKIEWAIGAIIAGDSKWIQKFLVFYGEPGSGKSTVLNIIESLFDGYCSTFDSKALGSNNNSFALEMFRDNPLIAIQHDGDLSRIEDNTKLNSIVSHEIMTINEKFKSTYSNRFNTFLFMGTNKPVRITDAKSGIIRRLIDVSPSGNLVERRRFDVLVGQIKFELGGIANHCLKVYKKLGPTYYDGYIPIGMVSATNDFYNFVDDNYEFFVYDYPDEVSLTLVWQKYKEYCEDAKVQYPYPKRVMKDEMKNYFREFYERKDNKRSVYVGFRKDKFITKADNREYEVDDSVEEGWLVFDCKESLFDKVFSDCLAQYGNESEKPTSKWDKCKTKLRDLDTSKLHYVCGFPENLICIDFDLKDENGDKNFELNLKEALRFPRTYAELSKSGQGIHLYYFYDGDVSTLSRIYDINIEVLSFKGKSSLRRLVSLCNAIPIANISSGLPLKEENKKVLSEKVIRTENGLRRAILRNLRKEHHGYTTPSIHFIKQILDEAYESGMHYDVNDMRQDVIKFAIGSSHQAEHCLEVVSEMKFASDEPSENLIESDSDEKPIVIYDIEIYPNLFVIAWKEFMKDMKPVVLFNPNQKQIQELIKYRLAGYNVRRYDNHILYAGLIGYKVKELFNLSQRIIVYKDRDAMFREAYNLSYTDVLDFLSAQNKMSLKKWEIKLHIHHQEMGFPWDEPIDEKYWDLVGEYCANDVLATEAVWLSKPGQADWRAREILTELSGLTLNDTTNNHTIKIIVGDDKNPWSKYIYTDLSTIYKGYRHDQFGIPKEEYLPGTKIVSGKSIYRGEDPGEGGYVYANPGMYAYVAVLDVESMHPHSILKLKIFGEEYTMRFGDVLSARLLIKHGAYDEAKGFLDGRLAKFLNEDPEKLGEELANALKTAINSVYGLTSATFPNKLKDPRNVDNIVAKYGALFMIDLKYEVQSRGYTVAHIKTDSIKIPNADQEIIEFCKEFAKGYGFTFEHESTYSKMCLVNEAVYIARYASKSFCECKYGYIPKKNAKKEYQWDATGAQFQIPYVFKTLFSHEPIEFYDMCETKSVSSAMYLDFNEGLPEGEHDYRFIGKVGLFTPIKDGHGGGVLLRDAVDKNGEKQYYSVVGTKGYRWMESEIVKEFEDVEIDYRYYNSLVDDAIDTISKYGDFERFSSNDQNEDLNWLQIPVDADDELPFDESTNMKEKGE